MKTKKLFVTGDNHILRVKLAVIDVAKIKSDSRRGDVLAKIKGRKKKEPLKKHSAKKARKKIKKKMYAGVPLEKAPQIKPKRRARRSTPTFEIEGWRKIRVPILERDGYVCRICGRDGVEACLNVHHIDYIRWHNESVNLVTLCGRCHRAVHNEKYKPQEYEDWPVPWGPHPREF